MILNGDADSRPSNEPGGVHIHGMLQTFNVYGYGVIAKFSVWFSIVLNWQAVLVMIIGVILGIMAGAMPGISPSSGVALLVPFTYKMPPVLALILLTSIYLASNYGGSIPAVLINTPGTPSAVVTAFDGYALTKRGEPGKGLG